MSIRDLRTRLDVMREEMGVDTLDLLECVAAMLVEEAVVARVEAAERPASPGLARALATNATELQQVSEAVGRVVVQLAARRCRRQG